MTLPLSRRELLGAALALAAPESPDPFHSYFEEILEGFLRCVRATSPEGACGCDYPGGTRRRDAVSRSGQSYASVTRMLPALAAWIRAGRDDGRARAVVLGTFRHAFDPKHADYWLSSPPDTPDLRQVESSLVAWCLWVLRDWLPEELGPEGRRNLNQWLASCTVRIVRYNNFAWFTAVNHAVRMQLSKRYPEFQGDEKRMLDDIAAMDAMYLGDGWYTDGKGTRITDYYTFWVFTSHYLYWREIIGERYPELVARFDARVRTLMQTAPYLFGANGSHALMGVSLIYRWAVLSPLVLAYRQGLWPHAPGLLRSIVQRNIEFFRGLGGFDPAAGKLRESFSAEGNPQFRESYIDNGHPYWCMQAYALYLIPRSDPFWTDHARRLPVEEADFVKRITGPGLLVAGQRRSGDVRLLWANNGRFDFTYRDRYTKFSYSAQFPFCDVKHRERATWDNALVFRAPDGTMAGRAGVREGKLLEDGVETAWWAQCKGWRIEVVSRVTLRGGVERRVHRVKLPAAAVEAGIEVREGSSALPLGRGEEPRITRGDGRLAAVIGTRRVACESQRGYAKAEVVSSFAEELGREDIHIVAPRCAIVTLSAPLTAELTELESTWRTESGKQEKL